MTTETEPKIGTLVRLRYGPGESGWAEYMGDGKCRVSNIPLCGTLNIDDVVATRTGSVCSCCPEVDEITSVSWDSKAALRYTSQKNYDAFRQEFPGKCEGAAPGIALIAFDSEFDIEALAEKYNCKVESD